MKDNICPICGHEIKNSKCTFCGEIFESFEDDKKAKELKNYKCENFYSCKLNLVLKLIPLAFLAVFGGTLSIFLVTFKENLSSILPSLIPLFIIILIFLIAFLYLCFLPVIVKIKGKEYEGSVFCYTVSKESFLESRPTNILNILCDEKIKSVELFNFKRNFNENEKVKFKVYKKFVYIKEKK